MFVPVAAANLVGNQLVLGVGIGNAQQGLGQTHQHDPLLAGEGIFMHEFIDTPALAAAGTDRVDQPAGDGFNIRPLASRNRARSMRLCTSSVSSIRVWQQWRSGQGVSWGASDER